MTGPGAYVDMQRLQHPDLFQGVEQVWEVLQRLKEYIDAHLQPGISGTVMEGAFVSDQVQLAAGAVVEPGAMIKGPAIIGPGAVIRQGAYVREYCLIEENCVVGHTSEVKGSILLAGSQAPHFNYVGDSLLGHHVNLGAGTKLSNLKNDHSPVLLMIDGKVWDTGMRKLGAILGDDVATGCNCVTSPGTLIGPGSQVYPNAVLRGAYPANSIVKLRQQLEVVERS